MSGVIDFDEIARRSGLDPTDIKEAEVGSVSGRLRRVREFDWAQVRRSALLNGPTDIALTFADYLGKENRKAFRYEQLNDNTLLFIEELVKVWGVPVSLISTDFSDINIIDRLSCKAFPKDLKTLIELHPHLYHMAVPCSLP